MLFLIGTYEQIKTLNEFENEGRRLEFVNSGSGTYYVGAEVLNDEYFEPILNQLKQLQTTDTIPNGK